MTGQDRALAVDGVVGVEISIPPGRPVVPLPEGDRYLGFIFARAGTPDDVVEALRHAEACTRGTPSLRPPPQPEPVGSAPVRILLVSTYELGHQPLHVAMPAAALLAAGHEVRCVDVAVDPLDAASVDWADRIAFSVPMHTAMRLALRVAETIRARRPETPLCFYGLYAPVSRDLTVRSAG